MKYKKDIIIDTHNLTEEILRQPQLYTDYARMAVKAEMGAEEAKHRYELMRADYENRIRNNPINYDLPEKPREGSVRLRAEKMPKVKRLYKQYMKMLHKSKILNRVEKGFMQRKNMLEAYVRFNINSYYAEPYVTQQRNRDIKQSLNQSRKLRRRK